MSPPTRSDVTTLLDRLREGDDQAGEILFDRVYTELRERARGQRKRWRGDPSLQTTALAHEAYLKLVGPAERSWENRSHFFAVAARAMRHVLINRARRKTAQKRGGDRPTLSLDTLREKLGRDVGAGGPSADAEISAEERTETLVLLGDALDRLEEEHPRAARTVECRVFSGMTIEETAEALGVSSSTVSRDWTKAKAWLNRELKRLCGDHPPR